MSMLVAVAGIIVVAILPGGKQSSDAEKQAITVQRMQAIEEAMKSFMIANLRRPCPADGSLAVSATNFGVEGATPGTCTGGTPAANFGYISGGSSTMTTTGGTLTSGIKTVTGLANLTYIYPGAFVTGTGIAAGTYVASVDSTTQITLSANATASGAQNLSFYTAVAGMVPTRSLGLPEEYALDGWGRRITYVVDRRATLAGDATSVSYPLSCQDLRNQSLKGSIRIFNSATDTAAKDQVMSALISYGRAGHGAFPIGGSSVANRINAAPGSATTIPTAGEMNAFIDPASAAFATLFNGQLVSQPPDSTTPYNSFVWYAEETKNTCCLGKACGLGFSIKLASTGGTADSLTGTNIATGDINGDGIADIAIGDYQHNTPRVYVIFGRKNGWPSSVATFALGDITGGTGTYGFYVNNNSGFTGFGKTIAIGDVNRDGLDDLIINGSTATIIWGATSFASASINTSALGASGITFTYGISGVPQALTVGDIQGTGYKSIILSGGSTSNAVWVIYDMAAATWAGFGASWNITANATTTYSFKIVTGDTTNVPLGHGTFSLASGDLNGDGKDDIVIGDPTASTNVGKVYVLFPGGYVVAAGTPPTVTIANTAYFNGTTGSYFNSATVNDYYIGNTVAVADMNGDGCKDLITTTVRRLYIYNGRKNAAPCTPVSAWPASADINSGVASATLINWSLSAPRPNWISATASGTSPVIDVIKTGDVNNDGKMDLLLGISTSGAPTGCSKGANVGSTYVLLQPTTGWATSNVFSGTNNTNCDAEELSATYKVSGFRIDGALIGDYAYIPIVADLNQDGRNDIMIAAPRYPGNGTTNQGAVFTIWGRKDVPWFTLNADGTTNSTSVTDLNDINY